MNKYEIKLSKNRVTYKETLVVAKGVGVVGEGSTGSLGLVDTNY